MKKFRKLNYQNMNYFLISFEFDITRQIGYLVCQMHAPMDWEFFDNFQGAMKTIQLHSNRTTVSSE